MLEEAIENPEIKSKDKREAQWMLGTFYNKGIGVEQDIKKAEELLLEPALADFFPAIEGLLFVYNRQERFKEAREWVLPAADRGNSTAQIQLAYYLWNGLGGEKNVDEARSLLKEAIKNPKTRAKQRERAQGMLKTISKISKPQKVKCRDVFIQA